jgi:CRP/FNR family transcriptional regulator
LERFPFFGQASGHLLDELLALLRPSGFEEGQHVYREQDACSGISFVLSGEIRVFKSGPGAREVTLYTVGPGEICILNAACILSGIPYPANATALSAGSVYALPAGEFRRLVEKYPLMRQFVLHGLSGRLLGIMQLVEEVLFRRLDERLAKYLGENAREGVLERTHQQIANDLGTSREVVSRLLGDLAAAGRIEVSRQQIRIRKGLVT